MENQLTKQFLHASLAINMKIYDNEESTNANLMQKRRCGVKRTHQCLHKHEIYRVFGLANFSKRSQTNRALNQLAQMINDTGNKFILIQSHHKFQQILQLQIFSQSFFHYNMLSFLFSLHGGIGGFLFSHKFKSKMLLAVYFFNF